MKGALLSTTYIFFPVRIIDFVSRSHARLKLLHWSISVAPSPPTEFPSGLGFLINHALPYCISWFSCSRGHPKVGVLRVSVNHQKCHSQSWSCFEDDSLYWPIVMLFPWRNLRLNRERKASFCLMFNSVVMMRDTIKPPPLLLCGCLVTIKPAVSATVY